MWRYARWLKLPLVIIVCITGITIAITRMCWGLDFSPTLVAVMLGTSIEEIQGFLSTIPIWKMVLYVVVIIFGILLFIIVDNRWIGKRLFQKRIAAHGLLQMVAACAVLALVASGFAKFSVVNTVCKLRDRTQFDLWAGDAGWTWLIPKDLYIGMAITARHLAYGSHEWEQNIIAASHEKVCDTIAQSDSLKVVLVIGESYQRNHAQLYDYPLPTTPRMVAERDSGNLIVFEDYASVEPHTVEALNNMLNLNRVSAGEDFTKSLFFPALFRFAGWDVLFFEHQNIPNYCYDMVLQNQLFNPVLDSYCWSARIMARFGKDIFDGDCLDDDFAVLDTVEAHGSHSLTLYQFMGQHMGYKDRYPEAFNLFDINDYGWRKEAWIDEKAMQVIASYDNAVLYNDYVIGRVFDRYRDSNTVVIYIPDHGEEVYDYRYAYGRGLPPSGNEQNWVDCQLRVPMVVWMSERFMERYPEKVEAVRAAAGRVGSSDDIGHMILALAGLQTRYYVAERDILSPRYVAPDRVSLVNRVPIPPLEPR